MAGKNERKMTANEFTNVKDIKKFICIQKTDMYFAICGFTHLISIC